MPAAGLPAGAAEPPALNTAIPHPARIYDYWLGACFR
jgi:hypothetical protein